MMMRVGPSVADGNSIASNDNESQSMIIKKEVMWHVGSEEGEGVVILSSVSFGMRSSDGVRGILVVGGLIPFSFFPSRLLLLSCMD